MASRGRKGRDISYLFVRDSLAVIAVVLACAAGEPAPLRLLAACPRGSFCAPGMNASFISPGHGGTTASGKFALEGEEAVGQALCPTGRFQDATAGRVCRECAAGRYGNASGMNSSAWLGPPA